MGYGSPRPNGNMNGKGKKGGKRKQAKKARQQAEKRMQNRTMRGRQKYALENLQFRRRVESVNGRGGIDPKYYSLPEDVKPKKRGKDYFFVMRKFVCFLMALVLLISVAYYVLGYVKIDAIPPQYLALFMETEPKPEESTDETDKNNGEEGENNGEEGENSGGEEANADVSSIKREGEEGAGEGAEGEGEGSGEEGSGDGEGEAGEGDGEKADEFTGTAYGVLDPVFGFIKYVGRKFNIDLSNIGDSPLYDQMIAKYEVGMVDNIAGYALLAFPVGLILYVVSALIMFIKAFLGMFNKRIYKCFGLGSIFMILFAALTAFGGLAFVTPIDGKMDFGGIVNILIDGITGAGGFTGGYGLLILIGLPVITLILSMFCRKKVPYSIFDTFGD